MIGEIEDIIFYLKRERDKYSGQDNLEMVGVLTGYIRTMEEVMGMAAAIEIAREKYKIISKVKKINIQEVRHDQGEKQGDKDSGF